MPTAAGGTASAQSLRAGQAIIELELLMMEKKMDKQFQRLRGNIIRATRQLGERLSSRSIVSPGASSRLLDVFRQLPVHADRFRASLSRLSALDFPWLSAFRGMIVGAGAGAALGFPLKFAANMELLIAQMSVFTGSQDSAAKAVQELMEFSGVAGQDVGNLVTQMRLLMTRGIGADQAIEDIKAISVLAAGSEDEFQQLTKAFADVRSATRLNGEEMRQFKNTAFNPFVEIAKQTGETMDQLKDRMEAGGISFDEVRYALLASVRAGGLFHGMLDKISGTAIGLTRQVLTKLKLALLPLGNELLTPFKDLMRSLLGLANPIQAFVSKNSAAIKSILGILLGIGALAGAFLGFKVIIAVLAMAVSALIAPFTLLMTFFTTGLGPIVAWGAVIGTLIYKFMTLTQVGQTWANAFANYFSGLSSIFDQTFGGIVNALQAGELALAGKVAMAGLNLAWLEGTASLRNTWASFKDMFLRTTTEMVFKAQELWTQFSFALQGIWSALQNNARQTGEIIGHWLTRSSDPGTAADQDAAHEGAMGRIRGDREATIGRLKDQMAAELAAIQAARVTADSTRNTALADELAKAEAALMDARTELEVVEKEAAIMAASMPEGKEWFPGGANFAQGLAGNSAVKAMKQPEAVFDTRMAAQAVGGIERDQLAQLRIIARNTKPRMGGGLPVV